MGERLALSCRVALRLRLAMRPLVQDLLRVADIDSVALWLLVASCDADRDPTRGSVADVDPVVLEVTEAVTTLVSSGIISGVTVRV